MDRTQRPPETGGPPQPKPKTGGAAADRLRAGIDAGRTGDKVDYPDPAAAPLGTDDEAGGTPPDLHATERAETLETGRAPLASQRPDPSRMQDTTARTRFLALLGIAVLLGLVILIWG